jgi:2'-5' RNA ligase
MPYAIAALFDAASEAGIQNLRAQLAEYAGLDAAAVARPHLTLAIVNQLDPEALEPVLREFCQSTPPIPLHLAAVGAFPTPEGVVYLAPVVTRPMLAAHAKLCRLLDDAGAPPVPYYRPESWVPHCTVAINLKPEQVGGAVSICCGADVFHTDQLTQLTVAQFPPMRLVYNLPLRGTIAPSEIVG